MAFFLSKDGSKNCDERGYLDGIMNKVGALFSEWLSLLQGYELKFVNLQQNTTN